MLKLAAVLQADAVITRLNEAVRDTYVFRVVYIDAVTIAYFQVVQDADAVNRSVTAADEMYGPISTVTDGDVADNQLFDVGQRQNVRTWVEIGHSR